MGAWADMEGALHAWVVGASGLAADHIIWSAQDGRRPEGQHVELRIVGPRRLGSADVTKVEYVGTPAGEEIRLSAVGVREMTLRCTCYGGDARGDASPRAILEDVRTKLALSTHRSALRLVGLTPFDDGAIQDVSMPLGTGFEPRSILEVKFYFAQRAEERVTYIEKAEITDETTDETFTVP